MKKQINPIIKAHLIRSTFYVLLLLAVCVIPFALAQENTPKRGVAKPKAQPRLLSSIPEALPLSTGSVDGTVAIPVKPTVPNIPAGAPLSGLRKLPGATSSALQGQAMTQATNQLRPGPAFVETGRVSEPHPPIPKAPAVVLYFQYDNATGAAFDSTRYTDTLAFTDYLADDFVVPAGETWTITEIDAMGITLFDDIGPTFNVGFFANGPGNLPGIQVYNTNNGTYTRKGSEWVITIPAAILTPGTYWVMVQGNGRSYPVNSWFWTGRSVQSNDTAAWQQPHNASERDCITWERRPICFSDIPNNFDQVFQLVGTRSGGGTPTPTPTGTPGPCQFQVLIVYADTVAPTQLQTEIQAEAGVTAVDLFDASIATPTVGQFQQYDIVVPFSNLPLVDGETLGNNLAYYVDRGGVVVQYGFGHYGPGQSRGINGRWATDGYNPYDYSTNLEFNAFSMGTFNAGHPLMAGVTALNSDLCNIVTPNASATEVAQNTLGQSLVAFRPVGTHTTVGVTAYVGLNATQSGDWGKVIVNAGRWLPPCGSPSPTPTATATATPTVTPTPTSTPRPTPTSRARPAPHPRPTPPR